MIKQLLLALLITCSLYSQDSLRTMKPEFEVGITLGFDLSGNYITDMRYPAQLYSYRLWSEYSIGDAVFLDCAVHVPSTFFEGLSYTLGATLLADNSSVQNYYYDRDSSYLVTGSIGGGGPYIGLHVEKMIFPWIGLFGSANVAYLAFEQKVQITETKASVIRYQDYVFTTNNIGTKSGAGIIFAGYGLKLKSGFTYLAVGNNENGAFVKSLGWDIHLGFAF